MTDSLNNLQANMKIRPKKDGFSVVAVRSEELKSGAMPYVINNHTPKIVFNMENPFLK